MSPIKISGRAVLLVGAVTALAVPGIAAAATGHVSVNIISAVAIVETSPMDFGTVGVTKTGGRIVLSPSGTIAGPASYSFAGPSKPGIFTVTGTPNAAVAISFSSGDIVTGPGPAMLIGSFTHNAGRAPTFSGAGSLDLAVGATVTIGAGQPAGSYSGSYTVVVNY
jgi:hypothetical protein